MTFFDQAESGCDQSSPAVAASSGKIELTTATSHGSGAKPVVSIACSISRPSAIACSERDEIQPKITAVTIQPHSVSLSFPAGTVMSGGSEVATILRAAVIAS